MVTKQSPSPVGRHKSTLTAVSPPQHQRTDNHHKQRAWNDAEGQNGPSLVLLKCVFPHELFFYTNRVFALRFFNLIHVELAGIQINLGFWHCYACYMHSMSFHLHTFDFF